MMNIYAASESPLPGISSAMLAEKIRSHGVDAEQMDDAALIVEKVLSIVCSGDLIITMGAGDVTELGHTIAERLRERGSFFY